MVGAVRAPASGIRHRHSTGMVGSHILQCVNIVTKSKLLQMCFLLFYRSTRKKRNSGPSSCSSFWTSLHGLLRLGGEHDGEMLDGLALTVSVAAEPGT